MSIAYPEAQVTPPDLYDQSQFVCRADVPVLPAHRHPTKGDVTPQYLELLATNINRRIGSGHYPLVLIGHSDDDKAETDQPPCVGYVGGCQVGHYRGNACLLMDVYYHKDKFDEAMTYPHRSPELVRSDADRDKNYIWALSLLRRRPENDLGLITYSASTSTQYKNSNAQRHSADMDRSWNQRPGFRTRRLYATELRKVHRNGGNFDLEKAIRLAVKMTPNEFFPFKMSLEHGERLERYAAANAAEDNDMNEAELRELIRDVVMDVLEDMAGEDGHDMGYDDQDWDEHLVPYRAEGTVVHYRAKNGTTAYRDRASGVKGRNAPRREPKSREAFLSFCQANGYERVQDMPKARREFARLNGQSPRRGA